MKNSTKSILAALSLTIVLASCSTKQENNAEVTDSTAIETVAPDTTMAMPDSTAQVADSTATVK